MNPAVHAILAIFAPTIVVLFVIVIDQIWNRKR